MPPSRRRTALLSGVALTTLLAGCTATPAASVPVTLMIATGSPSGVYYLLGTSLADIYSARVPGVLAKATQTGASSANVDALENNETGQFTFTTDLPFDANNRATWPISLVMQTPGRYSFASGQIALYAQDNWRIADRVRLNLGVRYDYDTDLRHKNFYDSLLDNPIYAGIEDFVSRDRGNDTNNLQPRVEATWDVFGSARFVARAGYGMYITRNRPYFQMVTQDGTLSSAVRIEDPVRLSRYPDINAILGGQSLSEFVSTGARSLYLLSDDYVLPYQHNITAGAGWQITPIASLDVDYVSGEGRAQLGSMDCNLPDLEPYVSVDARLTKAFSLPGGSSLQLFAEGYNITNVVNLSSTPNGNINSTSFLVRNTAADARQIQFGARCVF